MLQNGTLGHDNAFMNELIRFNVLGVSFYSEIGEDNHPLSHNNRLSPQTNRHDKS